MNFIVCVLNIPIYQYKITSLICIWKNYIWSYDMYYKMWNEKGVMLIQKVSNKSWDNKHNNVKELETQYKKDVRISTLCICFTSYTCIKTIYYGIKINVFYMYNTKVVVKHSYINGGVRVGTYIVLSFVNSRIIHFLS